MSEHDDWDYEISDENKPSILELSMDVLAFLGAVLLAIARIAIPAAIFGFLIWLLVKLTIFLMGV